MHPTLTCSSSKVLYICFFNIRICRKYNKLYHAGISNEKQIKKKPYDIVTKVTAGSVVEYELSSKHFNEILKDFMEHILTGTGFSWYNLFSTSPSSTDSSVISKVQEWSCPSSVSPRPPSCPANSVLFIWYV